MSGFTREISKLQDCEAVLEYVCDDCRTFGATWMSYHFAPIFESRDSRQAIIWAWGYPMNLQKEYFGKDYRRSDPVPRLTFAHGPVLTWRKAMALADSEPGESAYMDHMRSLDIDNWIAFALFGPHDRDGFAALRFTEDPEAFAPGMAEEFHAKLQVAHMRICAVIDSAPPQVTLSDREREVLEWMGRGKSASDIASILEIATDTVRTYVKRIYEKLGANDRVTATVRALKLGLITL